MLSPSLTANAVARCAISARSTLARTACLVSVSISTKAPQTPKIERKRDYLPVSAPWLAIFEVKAASFPMSKYADQVDSMVPFLHLLDRPTRWTINLSAVREHREQPS